MEFRTGAIEGVIWRPLKKYEDKRGWLCELFRHDDVPAEFHPVMGYISQTEVGIARGPHEHHDQADLFCFFGPSDFKVYLWDNRPQSPTYRVRDVQVVGASRPMFLIIPPGVAHAYRNVGLVQGLVVNCANRLYKGWARKDPIDEIRHEDDPQTPYHLD